MEFNGCRGKIYRIINYDLKLVYYGSTTQSLYNRFAQHKCRQDGSIKKLFQSNILPSIQLVQKFPCDNRFQLQTLEREYIEGHEDEIYTCVNKKIPTRTRKEYYETYRDKFLIKHRQYYHDNAERLLEKKKIRYERISDSLLEPVLCPCGRYTSKQHFLRHQRSNLHKQSLLKLI